MLHDGVDSLCIVYLSGGMTGTVDHGVAKFADARAALRERGYTVLCPSEASIAQNSTEKRTREHHLRRDVSMVLLADEVCVLLGWETSFGACIEVMIAVAMGVPVWRYETGERIDAMVLEHMDPRRFIMPVDFTEWWDAEDDDHVVEVGDPVPAKNCGATTTPYRGASLVYCTSPFGHRGVHSDNLGREW